jgi:hypothetical protein
LRWKKDIVTNPDIWLQQKGWNVEGLRDYMHEWADDFGPKVLNLFGTKP